MATINRKELYKKVWETPITRLSKEYGLSDVGFAKICRKHNIPRPPRGYWARKAAGYRVKQIPLPSGKNVTIEISPNPYIQKANKNKELVAQISPSEQPNEAPIVVPDRLTNQHHLTKQTSEILNGRQPDKEGIVLPTKKGCLDISVSKASLRRALRIMDTILKALEKRECEVYLSKGYTKTKIHNVPVSFKIYEKLVNRRKEPKEHSLDSRYRFGHSRFIEERIPSGDLCLTIHQADGFYIYGCQQNWNDGKKSKLEERINSFIDGLVTVAVAKIARDKEKMEEEKRRIERQKRLEEEREIRAVLRRKYMEEEARVNQLIAEAENWKKSQILRDYIVEIESSATNENLSLSPEKPLNEWLKWAKDQADRLDPLKQSPPSILDEECPPEEKRNEYSYYRY